ncbi:unnamed protein product [Durusdinium trenchii]|uniref:Uncharacterized protein n=1 Tax=Durusdinium trenchii TaxID=1381693 RepID=A0ABP0KJ85_9DINO
MEKSVKAAQAACLRGSDRGAGARLKSLQVEAAALRQQALQAEAVALEEPDVARNAEAVPEPPPAPEEDAPEDAAPAPAPAAPVEALPTPAAPVEAAAADVAPGSAVEARRSPRSGSSSLRLALESLVQQEDDDVQLAANLQRVLSESSPPTSPEKVVQKTTLSHSPGQPKEPKAKAAGPKKEAKKPQAQELEAPAEASKKVERKASPRPTLDPDQRPAWDDRFYVVEAPKVRRCSALEEEEHLAKDEVPSSARKSRSPRKEASAPVPSSAPKRSFKPKAQEKAKPAQPKTGVPKASPRPVKTVENFEADRHRRQASR